MRVNKEHLEADDLLDDQGEVRGLNARWKRVGYGRYELVVLDDQGEPINPELRKERNRRPEPTVGD